jgi:hypothetical protein
MNKPLKMAFVSKGIKQIKAAKDLGFDPAKLSKIINDWIKPTSQEKQVLSEYLDIPIRKLFNKKKANE